MSNAIELENVGAVRRVSIPIPEGGGIVVLRGRIGSGKSTTLAAVESLVTGAKVDLSARDGEKKGTVSGLGVTLTVARSLRRSGEIEVESLEGKLSVADLVDPGIQDPARADARRIKALIAVSGRKIAREDFAALLPEGVTLDSIDCGGQVNADDALALASKIKSDIERAARSEEQTAETWLAKAEACKPPADLAQPADEAVLRQRLTDAAGELSRLNERCQPAKEAADRARLLRRKVESLPPSALTLEKAAAGVAEHEQSVATLAADVAEVGRVIAELNRLLDKAILDKRAKEEQLASAKRAQGAAEQSLSVVREREELSRELAKQLADAETLAASAPSVEEIAAADQRLSEARQAIEANAVLVEVHRKVGDYHFALDVHGQRSMLATALRYAAAKVETILSRAIADGPLRVSDGRLVLDTQRGATYFADLSCGERWKIALDLAIEQLGERGLLVLPQEAYEGLDPVARREIAEHVRARGVTLLTAEATEDDEIVAEMVK